MSCSHDLSGRGFDQRHALPPTPLRACAALSGTATRPSPEGCGRCARSGDAPIVYLEPMRAHCQREQALYKLRRHVLFMRWSIAIAVPSAFVPHMQWAPACSLAWLYAPIAQQYAVVEAP